MSHCFDSSLGGKRDCAHRRSQGKCSLTTCSDIKCCLFVRDLFYCSVWIDRLLCVNLFLLAHKTICNKWLSWLVLLPVTRVNYDEQHQSEGQRTAKMSAIVWPPRHRTGKLARCFASFINLFITTNVLFHSHLMSGVLCLHCATEN